jgi:hypothetical protein
LISTLATLDALALTPGIRRVAAVRGTTIEPLESTRHLDRALGRVGAEDGVVEEHHNPVARELVERAFELSDERPQRAMILAQEIEDLLGLGSLGEGGVAAQVAEPASAILSSFIGSSVGWG